MTSSLHCFKKAEGQTLAFERAPEVYQLQKFKLNAPESFECPISNTLKGVVYFYIVPSRAFPYKGQISAVGPH